MRHSDPNVGRPFAADFKLQKAMLRLPLSLRRQKLLGALLKVFPAYRYQAIRFNGSAIVGDIRDAYVADTLLKGSFADYGYFALAKEILEPGSVHFDVGANAGFHTFGLLPFGEPTSVQYYLFEPNPECVACHHLSKRLYPDVVIEPEHAAVGDCDGEAYLQFQPTQTAGGHLAEARDSSDAGTTCAVVPLIQLDGYIESHRLSRVRLMKVDIEGSELRAFRGAVRSMTRGAIEHVYFEVNPLALAKQRATPEELFRLLQSFDYDLFWPHDDVGWIEKSYNQPSCHRFRHAYDWLGPARTRRLIRFNAAEFTSSPDNLMDLLAIHRSVSGRSAS